MQNSSILSSVSKISLYFLLIYDIRKIAPADTGAVSFLQRFVILTNLVCHQFSSLNQEIGVISDIHIFKSIWNAVLAQIIFQYLLIDNTSILRNFGLALTQYIFHIDTRGIITDSDIDFLLKEYVIRDLVVRP